MAIRDQNYLRVQRLMNPLVEEAKPSKEVLKEQDENLDDMPADEPIDEPIDDVEDEPIDEEPIDDEGIDEEPIDDEGIEEEPVDEGPTEDVVRSTSEIVSDIQSKIGELQGLADELSSCEECGGEDVVEEEPGEEGDVALEIELEGEPVEGEEGMEDMPDIEGEEDMVEEPIEEEI